MSISYAVFCLNHPAPTELYTLSLHDALPIWLGGQAADLDIQTREILRTRETLNQILADATGQPLEKIQRDVDRDYIMDARQALDYGMIDRVISRRDLPGAAQPLNGHYLNGQ